MSSNSSKDFDTDIEAHPNAISSHPPPPPPPNGNNSVSIMDDLEEGLVANTSPSLIQNRSSARSATATAVTATSPSPSSNRSTSSSVAASLRNDHVRTGTPANQPGAVPELATAAATAPAAITARNNVLTGPELVDGAGGLPLPMGMVESGFSEERSATAFNPTASAASAPPFGVGLVRDDDGPPVPIGMDVEDKHDAGKKLAGVELVDDDAGPDPPAGSIEEMHGQTNLVDMMVADEKKKASAPLDSIIVPPSEENEDLHVLTRVDTRRGNRGVDEQTPAVDNQMDIESDRLTEEYTVDTGGANDDIDGTDLEQGTTIESNLEEDRETQIIPEAFLVEERSDDGIVIQGEPLLPPLPWWKQRKAKLFLAAVFFLFVILAVSLGVPLSLKRTDTVPAPVVLRTNAPSQSNAPSVAPSSSPTAVASDKPSDTPSYSPSACVNQISSNAQKIDLEINDPFEPRVAVDGKDMVIVVQQGGWEGPVFIIFYTMLNGGWQRVNIFQEDGFWGHSSVALSRNTAFVGFWTAIDDNGAVAVYEKDQYGNWDLMENPFIHDAKTPHESFGSHVDIDGDLACVQDNAGVYLYRQENHKWVQFDSIIGVSGCFIAGDTIATRGGTIGHNLLQLYRYNQQLNGVVPIQDPIPTGNFIWSLNLSNDYLVYWDTNEWDAFMYQREEVNQTYTFLPPLNISGPEYNDGLALGNDILVVEGYNKTHVFAEQTHGKWEETITLDQSYWRYALSGRSLFAITSRKDGEVYYFDIAGCSQAMPTQAPSLSVAPTDSSSSSPSMIPSSTVAPSSSSSPSMIPSPPPTMTPSSSSSPTLLHCVEVAITYDQNPWETYWFLDRVVGDDYWNNELVKDHNGSEGDTSYVESICLREGEYIFTVWGGDGIGYYNVTSNGMLIVEGGEFGSFESTTFSIPFDPSS